MAAIHWLHPLYFAGAAAVVVPLVLHLLRGRTGRPLPLPTVRFLKDQAAATRYHWLRRWLVLLCRAAVFLLLAAAFARPYLDAYFGGGRATVVVVDNSFSLQASGRLDRLRAFADRELGAERSDEVIGVLRMNPHPSWIIPLTRDGTAVRKALQSFQPDWEVTRIEPALRLAADVLAAQPAQERRLIVATDHQRSGWIGADFNRKLPQGIAVSFAVPEQPPARQAWLHSAVVFRDADEGNLTFEASISAAAGARQPRLLRIFAESAKEPLTQVAAEVGAGETRSVTAVLPSGEKPYWIRAELDPDDLPVDDVAYVIAPQKRATAYRVALGAARPGEFDYVAAGVAAMDRLRPRFVAGRFGSNPRSDVSVEVVRSGDVLEGDSAARLNGFLQGGGNALVFVTREVARASWWGAQKIPLSEINAGTGEACLREWSTEHGLIAPMVHRGLRGLVGWRFQNAFALPASAVQPIAYWEDGTIAIGEARVGAGRLVICGFSPDRRDGDWPTESSFVPFLHRALTYLAEGGDLAAPTARIRVGDTVALPPGLGVWTCLCGPGASEGAREVEGAVSPEKPGVYAFQQAATTTLFAVNLATEESALTPWQGGEPWRGIVVDEDPEQASGRSARHALAASEAEQKNGLWGWCFAAAAGLLLIELAMANRTTR